MPNTMKPEETDELTDAELALWLRTPDGLAAMQRLMLDATQGQYGELPPEVLASAKQGLESRQTMVTVQEIQVRMLGLTQKMSEPWEGTRWQHVHHLNEEMKAIMDLMLDLPEPHRTKLMRMAVPFQEKLDALEKAQ